ncbi:unnamed protein product [Adineta steineri]|uniref:AAA+ ATPase domain-containing protein n=1 Tax=Adineta steineri TaxID=433720 RepID=A0A819FUZ8_9BILA|nr:unnamed protein product [Adineta steineri]CAF3874384.1 unnamed protein product [Adineta steineri]
MSRRYSFEEWTPSNDMTISGTSEHVTIPTQSNVTTVFASKPVSLEELTMTIRIKFEYIQLKEFVDKLNTPNEKGLSVFQLYALRSTSKPIDMSNQTERPVYRPNLFIRKNDKFGPWNFNYLLDLLELDYRPDMKGSHFPKIWCTTLYTSVNVTIIPYDESPNNPTDIINPSDSIEEINTLEDLLRSIGRQNKYDQEDIKKWMKDLEDENIKTIEHLQNTVMNEGIWEKVSCVKPAVKQMIYDYVQLNAAVGSFSQTTDSYRESTATLLGDIHRVKRYFYDAIGEREQLTYLDEHAVNLAMTELRKFYADDGNIISTIYAYLRTFCVSTASFTEEEVEKKRNTWSYELNRLKDKADSLKEEFSVATSELNNMKMDLETKKLRLFNISKEEESVKREVDNLMDIARQTTAGTVTRRDNFDRAKRKQEQFEEKKKNAENDLQEAAIKSEKVMKTCNELLANLENNTKESNDRQSKLDLINADEHRNLKVKIGRGLLLYGPPGTGKSELLKRAAVYAGITMTTVPLAAGELNRPYVGETEKLLIDIMYRANTIPYLMCAMTIDEIDGLVPKRDNNAQQSKVDGISVLLSHIEGVKNIPNLIVFGATNRRNMMDDAFLRRMQAKCFVGRPSPEIRKQMLRPLLTKDLKDFNDERLDFLVKITTNFSGAAIGALKSSIVSFLADNPASLSNHTLLSLANNTAREFSCWFGSSTLPEICRIYPNIFNTNTTNNQSEDFSLVFSGKKPTGRILVDLQERKCFIELSDGYTIEKSLFNDETSLMTLLARIINGCSSRNIDTIQIIDTDFLSKNNAFDENKIFELLATTFAGKFI